ncbi:hypothetical protein BT69DRAFT_1377942 [Atractiella rhizophila]|nr:hypothetical protein BT69DRAFT_1377942 [Atractiella rhizophila]
MIQYFPNTTVSLATQWFNKCKFHVLVHLVDNVKQFGVLINFATENQKLQRSDAPEMWTLEPPSSRKRHHLIFQRIRLGQAHL